MSDITFEIIFIFVLLIANGLFSMSEMAIVSARKARLQQLANEGIASAEDAGTFQTLGGLVMAQLGRIPTVADHFEWNGLRFEVMDMDRNRVDKVLVTDTRRK
jgi:CBS domain containing-hemolysin-like protein